MSDTNLLPCPFCGSKAMAFSYITEGAVRCGGCYAAIIRGHKYTSETGYEEAIAAWNRRAPADALVEALEEIASHDTGATAGLAYTAKVALAAWEARKGGAA